MEVHHSSTQEWDEIKLRFEEDAGPLGIGFKASGEALGSSDYAADSAGWWRLSSVRPEGAAAGRDVRENDWLVAVNEIPVGDLGKQKVIGILKARPLLLTLRRLAAAPAASRLPIPSAAGARPHDEEPKGHSEEKKHGHSHLANWLGVAVDDQTATKQTQKLPSANIASAIEVPQPPLVAVPSIRVAESQLSNARPVTASQPVPPPGKKILGVNHVSGQRKEDGGHFILEQHREEILEWIDLHDVCFIEAATGMGKSTNIPQYVLDENHTNVVWQLQPRRIAAKRLAEYISKVRKTSGGLGGEVGYRVRGDQQVSEYTRLTYMTTGYFLHFMLHRLRAIGRKGLESRHESQDEREARRTPWCTHLFVDEVHEASEETELVLLLVRMLGHRDRLPFKVVILSATLDFQTLRDYFAQPPPAPKNKVDYDKERAKVAGESEEEDEKDPEEAGEANKENKIATDMVKRLREEAAAVEAGVKDVPEPSSPLHHHGDQTVVEMRLSNADRTPLGVTFQRSGEPPCANDAEPDSFDGGCSRWVVAKVYGAAVGRVCVGDQLHEVNGQLVKDIADPEVVFKHLNQRPLVARFARPSPPAPVCIAAESLELASATPYEVDIQYLDEISPDTLLDLGFGDVPHFNDLKFRAGMGPDIQILELCAALLLDECTAPEKSALVFLPGIAEIEHFRKVLERRMLNFPDVYNGEPIDMVVLHSITTSQTSDVVRPSGSAKPTAYIASSIAETSITLPELWVVFDFGLSRGSVFDPVLEMEQLTTRIASKTSGKQRAGRVGRTKPGKVFRLYPRAIWDVMPMADTWGSQRNLESIVLLLTKTLVHFLGIGIRECLGMLVNKPSDADIALTLQRLDELDAMTSVEDSSGGQQKLTSFGEFAVCVGALGPRLARLVYCGLIFGCVRSSMVLAAIHSVSGKGELLASPMGYAQAVRDEDEPNATDEIVLIDLTLDVLVAKEGSGIMFYPWSQDPKQHLMIAEIRAGSWAAANDIQELDNLHAIDDDLVETMDDQSAFKAMRRRPVKLTFSRRVPATEVKKPASDEVIKLSALHQMLGIAKTALKYDNGHLSEPAVFLRLFDGFCRKTLKTQGPDSQVVSLHKLRHVDALTREIGAKLAGMCDAWHNRNRRNRKYIRGQQHVLEKLMQDHLFWSFDFQIPLSERQRSDCSFITDCVSNAKIEDLRLVLCAAFPGNFLWSSLNPPPPKTSSTTKTTPANASASQLTAPQSVSRPAEAGQPAGTAGVENAGEAAASPAPVPPLTWRSCGSTAEALNMERSLMRTYDFLGRCHVSQVEGQPPGNFELRFSSAAGQEDAPLQPWKIAVLNDAALLNMIANRDPRRRLPLIKEPQQLHTARRGPLEPPTGAVLTGELHVVPQYEWRLLRAPKLMVKQASKSTPLGQIGPVTGIGPALPLEGPGASGLRIAIAVELEATRLRQRQGKSFKTGRAARSWLMSWMPNVDSLDLAALLTFWSKDMCLYEDLSNPHEQTAYCSIAIGEALFVHFHEDEPLLANELATLRYMHSELQLALRTGSFREDYLPNVALLRKWGSANLSKARVDNCVHAETPLPLRPMASRYTHHCALGAVRTATPATERLSSSLGSGLQGLEDLPARIEEDTTEEKRENALPTKNFARLPGAFSFGGQATGQSLLARFAEAASQHSAVAVANATLPLEPVPVPTAVEAEAQVSMLPIVLPSPPPFDVECLVVKPLREDLPG